MAADKKIVYIFLLSVLGLSFGDRCPGYTDPFGDYVEAFDCPRPDNWADDPDETYCCTNSFGTDKWCCDETTYDFLKPDEPDEPDGKPQPDDDFESGWSTTYTIVIVAGVIFCCLFFASILWVFIRRRRTRQRPAAYGSPPGHCEPYAVNGVTYHPPPPPPLPMRSTTTSPPPPNAPSAVNKVPYHPPPPIPMQNATTSPPPPSAPPANFYDGRSDDQPPPYPGYPVPPWPFETKKENQSDAHKPPY